MPTPVPPAREATPARAPSRGPSAVGAPSPTPGAQGQAGMDPVTGPATVDVKEKAKANNHETRARMAAVALVGAAAGGGAVPDMDQAAGPDGVKGAALSSSCRPPFRPARLKR